MRCAAGSSAAERCEGRDYSHLPLSAYPRSFLTHHPFLHRLPSRAPPPPACPLHDLLQVQVPHARRQVVAGSCTAQQAQQARHVIRAVDRRQLIVDPGQPQLLAQGELGSQRLVRVVQSRAQTGSRAQQGDVLRCLE